MCRREQRKVPHRSVKGPREKSLCLGWAGDTLPGGTSHSPSTVLYQGPDAVQNYHSRLQVKLWPRVVPATIVMGVCEYQAPK